MRLIFAVLLFIHTSGVHSNNASIDPGNTQGRNFFYRSEFSFTVLIQIGGKQICTGAILTKWKVLTAAHCFDYERNPRNVKVFYGPDRSILRDEWYGVSYIYIHECYKGFANFYKDDLAVLTLTKWFRFPSNVQAIQISHTAFGGMETITAASWGITSVSTGDYVGDYLPFDSLEKTSLQLVPQYTCSNTQLRIESGQLCFCPVPDMPTCSRVPGGPIIYQGELVGIISVVPKTCNPSIPGVAISLSAYTNWLQMHVYTSGGAGLGPGLLTPTCDQVFLNAL